MPDDEVVKNLAPVTAPTDSAMPVVTKKTRVKRTTPIEEVTSQTVQLHEAPAQATEASETERKARRTALFPASTFEEALVIPNAIQKHAASQQVRRLTLFDQMVKSPDSGPSRQLITNANKYGLIKGNSASEHLELTPEGKLRLLARMHLREIDYLLASN